MTKTKRFLFIYASVFTIIWIVAGIKATISDPSTGYVLLLFGLAFSIVIFLASWFSNWIMEKYRQIDTMAKAIPLKNKKRS